MEHDVADALGFDVTDPRPLTLSYRPAAFGRRHYVVDGTLVLQLERKHGGGGWTTRVSSTWARMAFRDELRDWLQRNALDGVTFPSLRALRDVLQATHELDPLPRVRRLPLQREDSLYRCGEYLIKRAPAGEIPQWQLRHELDAPALYPTVNTLGEARDLASAWANGLA
jgi:hypothetical protein